MTKTLSGRTYISTDRISGKIASEISADRTRISQILDSPDAQSRPKFARYLALATKLTVEQSQGCLAVAGIENSAQTETPFASVMDHSDHPDVGASFRKPDEADDGSEVLGTMRALGLSGFKDG